MATASARATATEELRRIARRGSLHRRCAELPAATPADGPIPTASPTPSGSRSTGASTCARSTSSAPRSTTSRWARARRCVFVHGLSGCWQNWLENIPHFARNHRVIALDLPGFGAARCRPGRSRSPPTAASWTTSARSSGSSSCVAGRQLDGRLRRRRGGDRRARAGSSSWCWSRPPGSPARGRAASPPRRSARVGRAAAPLAFRFQMAGLCAARPATAAFRGVFDDPDSAAPASCSARASSRRCSSPASSTR